MVAPLSQPQGEGYDLIVSEAAAPVRPESWIAALRPGGRLVVHAVTQETEMLVAARWREHGGALTRIAVEHLEAIGGFHGWKPARAVVQWGVVR